jgi:hypothetical protein
MKTLRTSARSLVVIITLLSAAACSSGSGSIDNPGGNTNGGDGAGGGPGASGVDSAKSITELSSAEIAKYCDWEIQMGGGDGHQTPCGNSTFRQTPTKEQCKGEFALIAGKTACASITIARAESCIRAEANDACADAPVCEEINKEAEACLGKK